jgi:hypothetical protein
MQLPGKRDCCWTATADVTSFTNLKHSVKTDVAIVGAGIVGLTAAYLLTLSAVSFSRNRLPSDTHANTRSSKDRAERSPPLRR